MSTVNENHTDIDPFMDIEDVDIDVETTKHTPIPTISKTTPPMTPPRTVDLTGEDYLLFGSSSSSSSDDDWTPLCEPYGDQFGIYSMSLCDRYYDCTKTPFHTPSHIPVTLPLVHESPPRKRVRRRLFPHDNSTPPTPKYFRNINYID